MAWRARRKPRDADLDRCGGLDAGRRTGTRRRSPSRSRSVGGRGTSSTVLRPSPRQPGEPTRSRALSPTRWSGLAVEQRRDRAVVEDLTDGARDERRDRQHREGGETAVVGDGQGVRDDDLARAAVLQAVDGG